MKQFLGFAAVAAAVTLGGAWGVAVLRPGTELSRAVWVSAVVALGVQVLAFGVARPFAATNPIAGWGLGSVLRFLTLVLYALVGTRALGVASAPALVSLAAFLFVTMVIEPIFLKTS